MKNLLPGLAETGGLTDFCTNGPSSLTLNLLLPTTPGSLTFCTLVGGAFDRILSGGNELLEVSDNILVVGIFTSLVVGVKANTVEVEEVVVLERRGALDIMVGEAGISVIETGTGNIVVDGAAGRFVVEDETGSFVVEEGSDSVVVEGMEDESGSALDEEGTGNFVVGRTGITDAGGEAGNTLTEEAGKSALNISCFFNVKEETLVFVDNGFLVVLITIVVVVVTRVEAVNTLLVVIILG